MGLDKGLKLAKPLGAMFQGKNNLKKFYISKITEDESAMALDFLRPSFFKDEPLNKCINLVESKSSCIALAKFCEPSFTSNVSIKANDENGNLIAVLLNSMLNKGESQKNIGVDDPGFNKILRIFDYIDKSVDVFEKYPNTKKIFCNNIAAVVPEWQSQGVSRILTSYTTKLAAENGCSLLRGYCSNHYNSRALQNSGFQVIHSLKYEDYKENGEVVFKPEPPHNQMDLVVYML